MDDLLVIVAGAAAAIVAEWIAVWRAMRRLRREVEDDRAKRRSLYFDYRAEIERLERDIAECRGTQHQLQECPRTDVPRENPKMAIWRDAGLL